MRDSIMVGAHSPKRGREEEENLMASLPIINNTNAAQVKRFRKAKTHAPLEKDKTRGRYACLGHRMKHKRCPLDCPERRPKPNNPEEGNGEGSLIMMKEPTMIKPRARSNSAPKKHVLPLDNCILGNSHHPTQMARDTPITPLKRDSVNWDSVEWEGLSWDNEHCLKENESWMDLKSSSHWEESKSRDNLTSEMDSKPTDDSTKFEEEEIIDSWLNDDSFGNASLDFDSSEGNASETGTEARDPLHESHLDKLMRLIPRIIVTRDMLVRWIDEPYFNRLVQGFFVRVKVGEYSETNVYRLAMIDEVQDCFHNYSISKGHTNKGLSLQVGASNKKVFPIVAISNQSPTEYDFRTWQDEMENLFLDPLEIQQKEEIIGMLNSKYPSDVGCSQDVEPMVNDTVWN